jgi:hypothetical protein
MQRDIFEGVLKKKISQITFSGHRVNDDYSLNKRKAIVKAVMSAFDEAAQHCVHQTAAGGSDSQQNLESGGR